MFTQRPSTSTYRHRTSPHRQMYGKPHRESTFRNADAQIRSAGSAPTRHDETSWRDPAFRADPGSAFHSPLQNSKATTTLGYSSLAGERRGSRTHPGCFPQRRTLSLDLEARRVPSVPPLFPQARSEDEQSMDSESEDDQDASNGASDPSSSSESQDHHETELDQRVIRLVGLAYAVTETDIVEFFSDIPVKQVVVVQRRSEMHHSGVAYAELVSANDIAAALQMHHRFLKGRYVEIYPSEHEHLVKALEHNESVKAYAARKRESAANATAPSSESTMQSMRGCSPPFVRPATSYESTPSRVPEIASPPAVPSGASIPRMAALTTFQPRSRSPPAAQAPLLPRPSALTQSIYSTPMPSHQQPVEFETTPSAVPRGFQGPNSKAAGLFPTPSSAPHHGHLHVQEGMLPFNSKATMQALPQPPSPTAMSWRVGKHGSQEGAERGLDMFSTNNWSSKPDRVSPVAFPQSMHGGLPHVPEGLHAQPAASWNDRGFEELMSAFRAPSAFSMQKFQQEQPKQHQSQPKQPMQPMHPLPLEGYSQVAPAPLSYTMPAPQVLPAVTSTIHLQAGRVEQNEAPAPQLPPMTTEGVCTDWCVYLADVPADAPLSSIWKVFVELGLTPCGVAVTVVQQPQHSSLFSSKPVGPASSRFGRVYFTSSHAAAGARSHTKLWIQSPSGGGYVFLH